MIAGQIATPKARTTKTPESLQKEERLWAEFSRCMDLCGEHIKRAAEIVRKLDAVRADMSRIKPRLLVDLRKIAAGTLLPETAIKLAHSPQILTAVSMLPPRKQRELLDNPTVNVVRHTKSGTCTFNVPVVCLKRHEVGQVFCGDKIRTAKEQAKVIAEDAPTAVSATRWVHVTFNQVEFVKLKKLAAKAQTSMSKLIHQGCVDQGLI